MINFKEKYNDILRASVSCGHTTFLEMDTYTTSDNAYLALNTIRSYVKLVAIICMLSDKSFNL